MHDGEAFFESQSSLESRETNDNEAEDSHKARKVLLVPDDPIQSQREPYISIEIDLVLFIKEK